MSYRYRARVARSAGDTMAHGPEPDPFPTRGKPEKLLEEVRDLRRLRHYSVRTEVLLLRVDRALHPFAPRSLSLSGRPV